MNGDEKGEAHRPRPLSAGIWTLFSWLRRSDRSSSSESVSSVGSARTAVSFDFLPPGNYNFANPPIVLTTPLKPPTETYKRRLQERNLRRQRDRDVTLHRKYGLFRETGNGYDGFTLPPARRTLGNTLDRSNRERRANSESLQRRAAYVPGKRRAPLPPAIVTSTSLPRNYKRKRPAPKPPTKNTYIDKNIVLPSPTPVQMTSNCESGAKFVPDGEIGNSNKTQKYDKQGTTSKDTKSKTDKNFLKHIFENKKRSSVIETSSVRLLPSISELDKQATEIIEKNKLRKKNSNIKHDDINNSQNATALYEANSWFCTSCLRKYNSSVHSCSYCLHEKRYSLRKEGLKVPSPTASIYTQTNVNVETATSSIDERKILKDILKEMKDSLPKKNKDNKVNNVLTEIPTLRIGSTVPDTYKDLTTQPSSSSEILYNKNKILPVSSLLPETHRNSHKKNDTDQLLLGTNVQSSSTKYADEENAKPLPVHISSNNKKNTFEEINNTKETEGNNVDNIDLNDIDKIKKSSHTQNQLLLLSSKANDKKEIITNNLQLSPKTPHNILLGHRQSSYIPKAKIDENKIDKGQNQVSLTSAVTNVSTLSDVVIPKPSKLKFLDFPNSRPVVVNTVTVVATRKNTENNSIQTSATSAQTGSKIPGIQLDLPFKNNINSVKNIQPTNYQTNLENREKVLKSPVKTMDQCKLDHNLHTPLKISSLLNPMHSTNTNIVKENTESKNNASTHFLNKLPVNSINANRTIEIDNQKFNKEVLEKVAPPRSDLNETHLDKDLTEEEEVEETIKTQPVAKNVSEKDDLYEQISIASTSGCVSSVNNPNNNIDNLDHYHRRRHLINQLEQSIAKGDEVAAAEAAAKLAKLRLSCSVLSFSSQIIGEASNIKEIEKTEKLNILNTKRTSSKDKPLEKSIPQPAHKVEEVDTNLQIHKTEPDMKLLENHVSDKYFLKSNARPQQSTSEPSPSSQGFLEEIVPINVWIEDKQAARGPIRLNISRLATVADLRRQAEQSLGLAGQLQRWIIGRTLCSDDAFPILSLAGPSLTAPFYLCIVQPDEKDQPGKNEAVNNHNNNSSSNSGEFYTELMNLEKQSLVPNVEPFECGVCMEDCVIGAGVILRECIHSFCRECLSDVVQHSQEPVVACPAMGCSGFLQEREIRTIVTPEEHERWLARSLATAECGTRNAFHCRTRDCTGWAFCDPGVRRFPCPVCKITNCVQCKAIHEGETCTEYQNKLRQAVTAAETNKDDEGTQALLDSLISRGEALECPECRAIITKKWGCDWVKCSACKTEICWVTKGRRWGPGGRGDTSGGCRCGVDGQRCHPSCGYCH